MDLQRLPELRGVEASGGALRVGAMVREADLERTPGLPGVVAAALPHVGHFQVRTRGTVGGSLAHMDPAAEWPALAVLLDAELEVASSRRRRTVAAGDFALGPLTTALEPDELLLAVTLRDAGGPFGLAEVERRPGDFALVGAASHGGRVVVFATGGRPQRLVACEALLRQGGAGAELRAAAEAEIEATGDAHVSAAYRRRVGARLVERAVRAASAA